MKWSKSTCTPGSIDLYKNIHEWKMHIFRNHFYIANKTWKIRGLIVTTQIAFMDSTMCLLTLNVMCSRMIMYECTAWSLCLLFQQMEIKTNTKRKEKKNRNSQIRFRLLCSTFSINYYHCYRASLQCSKILLRKRFGCIKYEKRVCFLITSSFQ